MIISFIGSSCSGKTTTAARLFVSLKEAAFVSEFLPEQARMYITNKRLEKNLEPNDKLTLTDEDQFKIMEQQLVFQLKLHKACGNNTMIVTDSSPMNSLLYMTEEFRNKKEVQEMIRLTLSIPTFNFYAKPIKVGMVLNDPNRIHSTEESLKLDEQIPNVIFPSLTVAPHMLVGDAYSRGMSATAEFLKSMF